MGKHSVAEAKTQLSKLIDRANKGEEVLITRHGQLVAELKSIRQPRRRITKEALEWLDRHRLPRRSDDDAAMVVSRMRDEDWP